MHKKTFLVIDAIKFFHMKNSKEMHSFIISYHISISYLRYINVILKDR